ncbi:hypothetical protein AJ79_04453 [Helicocarpus griseus UAMH5409]|uniref:RNA-dependent RNA polymerase n=1 Tax=Helicocarpus griseus UAMH5409 TaxID=1447875 RepID=A0A2B7XT68_9EURO|nr:hypothetical protein AJ79_04453 [Helicocarpus griseus UAMH5409]
MSSMKLQTSIRGGYLYFGRGRGSASPRPTKGFGGRSAIEPRNTAVINGEWASWESVSLTLSDLPKDIDTFTVWESFSVWGVVDYIELYERFNGEREGKGRIRFRPPPRQAFWLKGRYQLKLKNNEFAFVSVQIDPQRPSASIASPTRAGVTYPANIELHAMSVDFGTMIQERSFLPLKTLESNKLGIIRLVVDAARREVWIYFRVPRLSSQVNRSQEEANSFRFRIPFSQLSNILQTKSSRTVSLVIPLGSPPICQRQITSLTDELFPRDENTWNSRDTWFRQTDIVPSPERLGHITINLRKIYSYINFGRWTTIRLGFQEKKVLEDNKLTILGNMFKDFNVRLQETDDLKIIENDDPVAPAVWKWIDAPSTHRTRALSSLEDLEEREYTPLPFTVRYQLEVCLSHRYLNEYTMNKEFVDRLAGLGEKKAKDLLEHVATSKITYYDPMKIFDIPFPKGATNEKIPKYCCYMRSAEITPSTIYYNTPSVDTSTRVFRYHQEYGDRFLRVRFTDEKYFGKLYSNSNGNNVSMSEVYTRVRRTLQNGITIGDRHYEFLAFGNSQFREHGAYFFASLPHLTAANIRAWMGDFNDIRIVAKHAARLGQCFSTTRAVVGCTVEIKEIEDIERNGYTFSDGVGRISNFLARIIQSEFSIETPSGEPPSVFQFRLGGCKGILTVSPKAQRREVHIRKSQYKFAAQHNGLEIIRHSHFSFATLNRQLIVVLSSLGVPDGVFIEKLRTMLANLEETRDNEDKAVHHLQTYVDPNQMTLVLADMVLDGFQKSREPFVQSLLELWRTWQIKYLKEKAKIAVDKGACLFGCIDETKSLKGYFRKSRPGKDATYEQKVACLPEIFVQVSRHGKGEYEIIKGLCILARNPSLHPGDIRVVNAVDVKELHHLKDVVVLPQTGDRDVSSMCSGGDLDGDDYVVIWDQDMLPKDWFREPMDYSAPAPKVLDRDVTVDDITKFYVNYMQNDRLPQIAHAHLAFADYLENGVNEEKCIRLAALHSAAVDYNKTGIPVRMTRDLKPKKWPHFMEKKCKKSSEYISRKILGQLYDIASSIDTHLRTEERPQFDERILNSNIEVDERLLGIATDLKEQYDADMRRIMAQHEIKTEFEVWSTFVLSHANMSKDYTFHEDLGRISSSLREKFRMLCYEKGGGKDFESLAPLAIAMYRVTSEQVDAAIAVRSDAFGDDIQAREKNMPLISFPWVLQPILGMIANQRFDSTGHIRIEIPRGPKPMKKADDVPSPDVETAGEVKHAGNILQLFENSKSDPYGSISDVFDTPQALAFRNENKPAPSPHTNGVQTGAAGGVDLLLDLSDDIEPPSKANSTLLNIATSENIRQDSRGGSAEKLVYLDSWDPKSALHSRSPNFSLTTTGQKVVGSRPGNENIRPGQAAKKSSALAKEVHRVEEVEEGEDEDDIVEIAEFEGDLAPTATDELEQMMGMQ